MSRTVEMIEARVIEIDARLIEMESMAALLRAEREELGTALRVMRRFGEEEDGPAIDPDLAKRRVDPPEPVGVIAGPRQRSPRSPTIPEMILEVLSMADMINDEGLAPKEITAAIRQRWWADARGESVGSIAWRMCNEGRLVKQDGRYRVPPEPSGELFARQDAAAERNAEAAG